MPEIGLNLRVVLQACSRRELLKFSDTRLTSASYTGNNQQKREEKKPTLQLYRINSLGATSTTVTEK